MTLPHERDTDETIHEIQGQAIERCTTVLVADAVESWTPPDVLFHLTNVETLFKIIEPSKDAMGPSTLVLRASETSGLNDLSEVHYGRKKLFDLVKVIAEPYERNLAGFISNPEAIPNYHVALRQFVTSFCERSGIESAGAWLHYGSDGTGIALGFHGPALATKPAGKTNCELARVEYEPSPQKERLLELAAVGRSVLKEYERPSSDKHVAIVAHAVAMLLSVLAVRLKHPAFADEREWRIVYTALYTNGRLVEDSGLVKKLRFGKMGQSIPFVEARLPPSALKEIVLGRSCRAREDHIREQLPWDLQHVEVRRSDVPVRPT